MFSLQAPLLSSLSRPLQVVRILIRRLRVRQGACLSAIGSSHLVSLCCIRSQILLCSPGLGYCVRITVMLCMAWTGLALLRTGTSTLQCRVQRGGETKSKRTWNHEWATCTVIGHAAAAATWCGTCFRLGDKCRHLIRTRRGSKGTWKGKGHRNRLIGRETRMWKREKGHCRLRLDQYRHPLLDMAAAVWTARASLKRGPLKPKSL